MAFWTKIKGEMKNGMIQGVAALKEGSNLAAEKAGQFAEMGKVRYQIFLIEQQTEKNFAAMGERIYRLIEEEHDKDPVADEMVKQYIAEAKKLGKKLKLFRNKMALLRKKVA